jgi:hypothetical protein
VQLTDILELSVRAGLEQRLRKHAGVLMPLAIGAMIPGIVHKAVERSRATTQQLDHATYDPMKVAALPPWLALPLAQLATPRGAGRAMGAVGSAGKALGADKILGAPGAGIGAGLSAMVQRKAFGDPNDLTPHSALNTGARKAVESFGSEVGKSSVGLLRDIAMKAMDAVGHAGDDSARQAILGDLKRADPVLASADDATLMEAYHTMTRFAPVLSTDKNAVRSFLRQAVMSGSGPDYMSIKLLADAERAVTGERKA